MVDLARVVITGVGVASPNGSSLGEFRESLLKGVSGVESYTMRHIGEVPAGVCHFDPLRYQKRKEVRRGTRAGSVAVWCAHEALSDAGLRHELNGDSGGATVGHYAPHRTGVYPGITEHGNVETENQVLEVAEYDFDLAFWSHHHNPRTVANNPAGEVTLSLGISGPAYCLGGACAAGNLGLIHGAQHAASGRGRPGPRGRRLRIHPQHGHLRQLPSPGSAGEPPRSDQGLAALRSRPQRHRGLRGRLRLFALERLEDALATRRQNLRGGHRLQRQLGRARLRAAATRWPGSLHPRRARTRRDRARGRRPGQQPRHLDALGRRRRVRSDPLGLRLRAVRTRQQHQELHRTLRWVPPARSSWPATCPRSSDGWVHPTINVDALDPLRDAPSKVWSSTSPHARTSSTSS